MNEQHTSVTPSVAELASRADDYLRRLTEYPDRHVGGPGNQAATELFATVVAGFGFDVNRTSFDCIEWEYGEAVLEARGERFEAHVGPYSLPCDIRETLVAASRVEDLESEAVTGRVVLIHGDLASGQIMPKNFTFYNPEGHKRIVRALEQYRPAAVVAATGRDPQMVGSQYPFPLFEDGDLDVCNAYMSDVDGERLLEHVGEEVALRLDSTRVPTTAEHVVATRAGDSPGRILLTAHIDSRKDSPGALDNATGVATLMLAAELLASHGRGPRIEIVPFNGEDNYANPGEMMWLAENEGLLGDIVLGINIDDSGQVGTIDHVSFYGCPPELDRVVSEAMDGHEAIAPGPQWFMGDHAILGMYGCPAIAIASSDIEGFMANYAHTERDAIELADPALVAQAACFIRDVVERL